MVTAIKLIISIIFTSFYLFPFEFVFLPGVNTKMVMAALGGVLALFRLAQRRMASVGGDFMRIVLYSFLISLVALISYVYNNTVDYSFVRYPVAIFVWLAGAYCLCEWIRFVHGYLSVELISRYLIAVCVLQCILAISIDRCPPLKQWVNSFLGGEDLFMGVLEGRLYGIGCALDVAGGRFAAILVIISYLSTRKEMVSQPLWVTFYVVSTVVLMLIGNMIGRTTTVGAILAIGYWIYVYVKGEEGGRFIKYLFCAILLTVPYVIYLYNNNLAIHDYLRFGFEGFFSLAEKGEWDVGSNNMLKDMMVFPDNLKTWLIGDAYAMNPSAHDPLYVGPVFKGFYMNTDVGYLRFIFYFGAIGCFTMILFIGKVASICASRFRQYKTMFVLLLLINLIIWLKVTTDIFLVFAPFICVGLLENKESDESIDG